MAALAFCPSIGPWVASCFASLACSGFRFVGSSIASSSARAAYCSFFALALIVSWILRYQAKPLIEKIPWIIRHSSGSIPDTWYGDQAVFRVALGNFLFFALLAISVLGVQDTGDRRHRLIQHGSWGVKVFLWIVLMAVPFFLPMGFIAGFAWVARVLSGLFLVIQMLLILDFAYVWSDSWVNRDDNRWLAALLASSVASFAGGLTVIGLSYKWFHPPGAGDCSLNMFLVSLTLILGLAYSALALHPSITHGSLLCSAIIFFYCSYMTFSALSSEPSGFACNGRSAQQAAAGQAATATSMLVTVLSVVWSAFRTGSASDALLPRQRSDAAGDAGAPAAGADGEAYKELGGGGGAESASDRSDADDDRVEEEGRARRRNRVVRPVAYNYSFFHLIFALASCYSAMLMTDWGSGTGSLKDQVGVGWTSVWVKMISQWVTIAAYMWSLIAPVVLTGRDFS